MKRLNWLAVAAVGLGLLTGRAVAYDNTPIVILREDDCRLTCKTPFPEFNNKNLLDYGKQLSIPITWGVITSQTSNNTALSWTDLVDYVTNAGGELASHSATHTAMNSEQSYINDLMVSKSDIARNTPFVCKTFIQPGTWTGNAFFDNYSKMNSALAQYIKNCFSQSQLYLDTFYVGAPILQHGLTCNYDIDYRSRPIITDFLYALDNIIANTPGGVYEICFHGIQSPSIPNSLKDPYCTNSDFMAATLQELYNLRQAGKIRLMSINDAYNNNSFTTDVNRVYDPGFEYSKPEIKPYTVVWQAASPGAIVSQLGYNGSKCGYVAPNGSLKQNFSIPEGRYRLTWLQKPVDGTSLTTGITPIFYTTNTQSVPYILVQYPVIRNSSANWEQKTLFFKNPPNAYASRLTFSGTGAYLIDNVSLTMENAQSSSDVSGLSASPGPTGVLLSWRAPDNTDFTKIMLRYRTNVQCPQTTSDGTLIQTIPAQNGQVQSLFVPFSWANKSCVYFSAFALRNDDSFVDPDVCFLYVDSTKPTVLFNPVIVTNSSATVSWQTSAANSAIVSSLYSIGSTPYASDIANWTNDPQCTVQYSPLIPGNQYYVMVKSQNTFGIWSDVVMSSFSGPNISSIFKQPDGDIVQVTGLVSAIFGDYYYIQDKKIPRGIKVIGPTDSLSIGASKEVQGTLGTQNGERYIQLP